MKRPLNTKRIDGSAELRLKGWRAALKSPKTPRQLRPALRANIRRLSRQLKQHRQRKGNGVRP
jgi:hypothetical protein